ncbi:MAG: hypothetical protein CSA96_03450 [Bacteroidetes bacterium]|nr:MAG: hypothetical protein CSA96_03450 [Bacteroidota bacterium]
MDFRSLLQKFPSGTEKNDLTKRILEEPACRQSLLRLALRDKDPLAWRAAWIFDAADEQEAFARGFIPEIVQALPGLKSSGSMRCLLRMLSRYEIPEDEQGILLDICFSSLVSEAAPIAVKAHAMQIIYQHSLLYPELGRELKTILEDQMENNTAGYKSRARRILKQLKKN